MKKIKKLLFTTLLFLSFGLCYSQSSGVREDVVYLKNGSILRGTIIEQIPNKSIKIETKDRNVFFIKYDEIEKITNEKILNNEDSNVKINPKDFNRNRFISLTEINYSLGIGKVKVGSKEIKNVDYSYGFRTVNGYQFDRHLSIGLGVGIDKYRAALLSPITFDLRASLMESDFSPVINASIGYSVGLNNINGGLLVNPSFGFRKYISKKVAFLFNIGFKLQEGDFYTYTSHWVNTSTWGTASYHNSITSTTTKVYFKFFTVNMGFSF